MKTYTLSYDHTGLGMSKTTEDVGELFMWLETALDDPYVSDSSIIINTEIGKDENIM